jgi:competence protein ComEA
MASDDPPPEGWTPGASARQVEEPGLDRWGQLRDFVRERLPPAVRGARVDPGVRGALALAVVALLAAVTALVMAWSSAARPVATHAVAVPGVAVPGVAVPKLSGAPSPVSPVVAPSSAAPDVVVDVTGKVRRPGLVKLSSGARVADAIASAGGVLPGASTIGLSLARRLVDGEQLLIGLPQAAPPVAPGSATTAASAPTGPVDLNSATVTDLDALPGIGPVLAQRVIDWRAAHGSFTSVDQLREVSGLGGKKFDALAPLVRV